MEQRLTVTDLDKMERIQRINFTNTLSGFKAPHLIGTMGHRGRPNLGLFSSVVHIGGAPMYLGFILRPLTVPRHTYHNIKAKGFFTINHIHSGILPAAHQTSADYPAEVSEFESCGLTPQYSDSHPAPYVRESHIKLGLQFEEEHIIQANDSLLIVGKVIELFLPADALTPDGHIHLEQFDSLAVAGLDTYYRPELLMQLPYARPGQEPRKKTDPAN